MSYEWPQEPGPLFAERFQQMLTQGIPEADAQSSALRDNGHVARRARRLGARVVTARGAI